MDEKWREWVREAYKESFRNAGFYTNDLDDEIAPPTIPLDFSEHEIEECKKYAYKKLKAEEHFLIGNSGYRRSLSLSHRIALVNKLSKYFDEAVRKIKST